MMIKSDLQKPSVLSICQTYFQVEAMKDLPAFLHFSRSPFLSVTKKLNKSSVSV